MQQDFWENLTVRTLAGAASAPLAALVLFLFRQRIHLWWVARKWPCERCGESVPHWFGSIQYELSNGLKHPPTVTLVCAVCERLEPECPTPIHIFRWAAARRRALLRRQRAARSPLGAGEVLDPEINRAMREADRARLAKVKEDLK